jgi:hypothetical protein
MMTPPFRSNRSGYASSVYGVRLVLEHILKNYPSADDFGFRRTLLQFYTAIWLPPELEALQLDPAERHAACKKYYADVHQLTAFDFNVHRKVCRTIMQINDWRLPSSTANSTSP